MASEVQDTIEKQHDVNLNTETQTTQLEKLEETTQMTTSNHNIVGKKQSRNKLITFGDVKVEVPSGPEDEYEEDEEDGNNDSISNSSSDSDSEYSSSSSEEEYSKKKSKYKPRARKRKVLDEGKDEEITPMKKINLDKLTLKIMPMQILKRTSTTLAEKLKILERIKSGESQSKVASSLKLNRSTIQNIWSERARYEELSGEMGAEKRRCRKPTYLELEKLVLSWVEHMQKEGTPANGPQICEHARIIAKGMGIENFSASSGWLISFRNRNNVAVPKMRKFFPNGMPKKVKPNPNPKPRKNSRGKKKASLQAYQDGDDDNGDWDAGMDFDAMLGYSQTEGGTVEESNSGTTVKSELAQNAAAKKSSASNYSAKARKAQNKWITDSWTRLSNGYQPKDIFFLDEFGLFYRALPENYKQFQGLSCFDGESAADRLSILLGTNSLGTEKLKLAIVGSSPYPSSFGQNWNQSEQDKLPTEYWFHPKAFITSDIVSSWLSRWNTKLETENRKVLVVLGSSRVHQTVQTLCSSLACISIVVLPAALGASSINCLETEISSELKRSYKQAFLNKLIRKKEARDTNLRISILDASAMLHLSWENLDSSLIADVFIKSGLVKEDPGNNVLEKRKRPEVNMKNVIQMAREVGVKFPKELTFRAFVEVDENLIAVDTSTGFLDGRSNIVEDDEPPCLTPPSTNSVLNSLDHLRSWAVASTSVGAKDLKGLHEAVCFLQSFCLNRIPPSLPQNTPVGSTPSTSGAFPVLGRKTDAVLASGHPTQLAQIRGRSVISNSNSFQVVGSVSGNHSHSQSHSLVLNDNESTSSSVDAYSTVDTRAIQSTSSGQVYGIHVPSLTSAPTFGNQAQLGNINYIISNGQIQELTAAANLLQHHQQQNQHIHSQCYGHHN